MEANPYLSPAASETAAYSNANEYRPASLLVPVLSFLLGVEAILYVAAAGALWFTPAPGLAQSPSQAPNLLVVAAVGSAGLALVVTTILVPILFLVWIHRANGNAWALGAKGLEFTGGRCVISFFIPFLNFYRPYQAVTEIYQASEPGADALDWVSAPASWLIRLWWAFWLVVGLSETVETFVGREVFPPAINLLLAIATAAAAGLASAVVWSIHMRQQEKALRRASVAAI